MLSAADTFRAAAADQLEIWAKRAGADIVRHGEGADPAAVVFDSHRRPRRGSDIIVDTAGRLHNKANLMNELAKIDRVISVSCRMRRAKRCSCWMRPLVRMRFIRLRSSTRLPS